MTNERKKQDRKKLNMKTIIKGLNQLPRIEPPTSLEQKILFSLQPTIQSRHEKYKIKSIYLTWNFRTMAVATAFIIILVLFINYSFSVASINSFSFPFDTSLRYPRPTLSSLMFDQNSTVIKDINFTGFKDR